MILCTRSTSLTLVRSTTVISMQTPISAKSSRTGSSAWETGKEVWHLKRKFARLARQDSEATAGHDDGSSRHGRV